MLKFLLATLEDENFNVNNFHLKIFNGEFLPNYSNPFLFHPNIYCLFPHMIQVKLHCEQSPLIFNVDF